MKIDTSSPPYVNLTMMRGDTEVISIRLKDSEGQPVNFNQDDRIYFTVKTRARREDKVIQKVITDFDKDLALINIDPEDTKSLRPGNYVYDIQLSKANGLVRTLIYKSDFRILEDVTHE